MNVLGFKAYVTKALEMFCFLFGEDKEGSGEEELDKAHACAWILGAGPSGMGSYRGSSKAAATQYLCAAGLQG